MHVKKNDRVQVLTGNFKGQVGRVLRVIRDKRRVVVEGVNKHYKHVRRSQQNPQGGRVERETPIDASNVMLVCGGCDRPVRTRVQIGDDAKKRVCARCGSEL